MSAIAGIFSLDGAPLAADLIGKLTRAMESRGPEGTECWTNGQAALGHCMLRTTIEAQEESRLQVSPDGNLVLVFDGRLDNCRELISEMSQHGIAFGTRTDAEVVIAAYLLWSDDCAAHLLGDFSFAILEISQKKLFCARDHVGARPFYYVINDKFFAFASDDEALLNIPGVSKKPYDDLVAHFLVAEFQDFDPLQTWLKDVRGLMSAHYMIVTPEGIGDHKSYWQFEPGNENEYDSDGECQAAFLDVFGMAVQSRLRLNAHPSAIISGGMDSGGILAMMSRLIPGMPGNQFHTYSLITDDSASNLESRCIQSMTQRSGVNAHTASIPSFKGMLSLEDLVNLAWARAHPVDNSLIIISSMCLAANRNGHSVLLHGVSGDLTMGNPLRYIAELFRAHLWRTGWKECTAAAQNHTNMRMLSAWQILVRNVLTAFTPGIAKRQLRSIQSSLQTAHTKAGLLNPDFKTKLDLSNRMRQVEPRSRDVSEQAFGYQHAASIFSPKGILSGLSGYQRSAAKFGVEMRDPWADKRVLEFFLRLPLHQLVREGWTKYLARSTFERDLGQNIVWRNDKEHLGWMYTSLLMDECKEFIEYSISDELNVIESFVDIKKTRYAYAQYKKSGGVNGKALIYDIVTLIQWIKRISG